MITPRPLGEVRGLAVGVVTRWHNTDSTLNLSKAELRLCVSRDCSFVDNDLMSISTMLASFATFRNRGLDFLQARHVQRVNALLGLCQITNVRASRPTRIFLLDWKPFLLEGWPAQREAKEKASRGISSKSQCPANVCLCDTNALNIDSKLS